MRSPVCCVSVPIVSQSDEAGDGPSREGPSKRGGASRDEAAPAMSPLARAEFVAAPAVTSTAPSTCPPVAPTTTPSVRHRSLGDEPCRTPLRPFANAVPANAARLESSFSRSPATTIGLSWPSCSRGACPKRRLCIGDLSRRSLAPSSTNGPCGGSVRSGERRGRSIISDRE
jgi:hypothetical protein